MSVQQLPHGVIKLISSTQVISSVSSVVKELVENSIDAGASLIDIKLERNGLDKIEIRDNGSGINLSDIYNVCLPNYTSKIHNLDDLEHLESYGFRGEALHSLCSVSQVVITTKTDHDEVASTYTYDNNGTVRDVKPSHQQTGTVVTVTNLFRNVPVRKQFYENSRKGTEELKKIEKVVKLLSIIHPKLRVTVAHNKCLIWHKTSVYSLRQSLMQVYPQAVLKNMEDVSCELLNMSLEMLIAKRECNLSVLCQPTSEAILLYINQRPVRDKKIEKVVFEEMNHLYASTLPANKCPLTLISLKLPPESLDVNLEPNKTKIFLKDHEEVLKQLRERIMLHFYDQKSDPDDPKALLLDADELQNPPKKRKLDSDEEINDVESKISTSTLNVSEMRNLVIEKTTNTNAETALKELVDLDLSEFEEDLNINPQTENIPRNIPTSEGSFSRKSPVSLSSNIENVLNSISCDDLFDDSLSQSLKFHATSEKSHELKGENVKQNEISNSVIPKPNSCDKKLNNCDIPVEVFDTISDHNSVMKSINTVTLSQWSRGQVMIKDKRLESGTSIINDEVEEKKEKEEPQLKDTDALPNEMNRSVSSQMGRKDMAGFTHFARQIRADIIKESPGITFTKVAGELASRWRNLQDEQKEKFKEEAKTKKSASVEEKPKTLFKKKTLALEVSMKEIIEELKIPGNLCTPRLNENKISLIGSLDTNGDWLCKIKRDVKLVNVGHLQENVLFHRYICNSSIPLKLLDRPIEITMHTLGPNLWNFLLSLERICEEDVTSIADQRIGKNGFFVVVRGDSNTCEISITKVGKEFDDMSIKDIFIETVQLASENNDLEHCRANVVKNMLLEKVIEVCEQKSIPNEVSEIRMLLQYWVQCMSQNKICSHEQPIAVQLHRL